MRKQRRRKTMRGGNTPKKATNAENPKTPGIILSTPGASTHPSTAMGTPAPHSNTQNK